MSVEFPATVEGYAGLAVTIGDPGGCAAVRVEGTCSYGAAPIPASSGKTSGRMRLNRGGDLSADSAFRLIVTRRVRLDLETQRYVERQ